MSHLLGAEALRLEYPTRVVFESISLGLNEGDRIGVVGRNGDGKSSLLGLLSGRIEPDAGRVTRRGGLRMGLLAQTDELDSAASVGWSIVADRPQHEWAGDAKIRDVIDGLVPDLPWDEPVGRLSGGQRHRVALARLLVEPWDVIALDEPTNHLDVQGITWLASHLRSRWPKTAGGLLVVTHDRWFLDEVCTATWEVHDQIVEPFEGGYAAYVLQRVERDRQTAVLEAKRQNLMRKELAWLRRGAPARTAKPKFRIEAANRLIQDLPAPRDQVELARLAVARLGKDVIDLLDAGVSFGDRVVLRDVEWRIAPGERTAVLGANGTGKSTLLGLIAGTIQPTSGRVKRGKTVQVAMLDQHFRQLQDIASDRVREVLARVRATWLVEGKEVSSTQLLERLGFDRRHLSARVGELSGGQRRRLQLLLLLLDEPNVVLLDEPSNDVDIDMLAAMEDLFDSWPGTLIVVSHDRYLVERISDQQYAIWDGRLRHLPGGVDQYLELQATRSRPTPPAATASTRAGAGSARPASASALQRGQRKELAALERRIEQTDRDIAGWQTAMVELDPSDYLSLAELAGRVEQARRQREEWEQAWLELAEAVAD
ncbi:MAG: ABC-F family ATP-binding cassette domain-containing protein [Propionibacteriaceae bacterium]|jgi:ATPase subunit of ABC transporter with duplicated ATPase domains|nr:ABC-F family ATP-binding cassette domain-containing protein [Propionibacteriaceae bacterium]